MSDNRDQRLDELLRSRRFEAASPDLAARIILQAQSLPQLPNVSLWQALRQMFAEFHLPKPGYVLASALVLGMVLGFSMTPESVSTNDASWTASQSYMIEDDEGLL